MNDSETIGGFRVILEPGYGWRCECTEFQRSRDCNHLNKAAALRTLRLEVGKRGADQVQ